MSVIPETYNKLINIGQKHISGKIKSISLFIVIRGLEYLKLKRKDFEFAWMKGVLKQ